ncbi:30S ribosomal protein S17 [Candidatus Falkowbacteria bacterium]|nr:30S ribosomal protein S17 [Candidatus Falkowbacteria bacterium]
MSEKKIVKNKRAFEGIVVGNKMVKTISVLVTRSQMHPKYKKRYKISKKYKVHDENKQAQVGDKVSFEECRPISKDKKWRLIKIVK